MDWFIKMEENIKITKDNEKSQAFLNKRTLFYLKISALTGAVIVMAIFFLLVYYIRQILGIFVLAFLLSYIVAPVVSYLESRGLNRTLIVALFYLLFIGIVITCAVIFLPIIWRELIAIQYGIQDILSNPKFGENIMSGIENFQDQISETFPMLKDLDLKSEIDVNKSVSGIASWILNYIGQLVRTITGYSWQIIWVFLSIFIIPFITFFLLKDGKLIKKTLLRLIPERYCQESDELLQKINHRIGRFIRGRIAESIILSILTSIGLNILGIRYALLIGIIAGFANLVPYVGPVGISIPPILLAIYQFDIIHGIITAVFLIFLQIIDNMVLVPFIVGRSVDLHPLVTMLVVFIGGKTLGLLGLVAAVPIGSILILVFQTAYKEFRRFPT